VADQRRAGQRAAAQRLDPDARQHGGDRGRALGSHHAWPTRWRGAPLDALNREIAIESLTLVSRHCNAHSGVMAWADLVRKFERLGRALLRVLAGARRSRPRLLSHHVPGPLAGDGPAAALGRAGPAKALRACLNRPRGSRRRSLRPGPPRPTSVRSRRPLAASRVSDVRRRRPSRHGTPAVAALGAAAQDDARKAACRGGLVRRRSAGGARVPAHEALTVVRREGEPRSGPKPKTTVSERSCCTTSRRGHTAPGGEGVREQTCTTGPRRLRRLGSSRRPRFRDQTSIPQPIRRAASIVPRRHEAGACPIRVPPRGLRVAPAPGPASHPLASVSPWPGRT